MLAGIPFSIYYHSNDITAILLSSLITILTGAAGWYLTRHRSSKEVTKREGYIIVTFGWIFISLFGALPFIIHGSIPSFSDAFFETMSGFTTTGATILTNIEAMPYGLLFWRALTQWLGGMGIIVLSIAILPLLGIGGMQLFIAEVPGPTKDKIHPRVSETAKRLWGIYFILTVAETILLFIGGMTFFDAITHSLTTMATGGFSTKNASVGFYSSPFIQYVITFFMFLAGVNFTIHYYALHRRFDFFKHNNEFRFYSMFIIVAAIVVMIVHLPHDLFSFEESFRQSLFHVVSLVTTTGFVTSDYENWAYFSRMIFFILLFIGGCAGSTGGGIKIIRHYLLLKNSLLELKRVVHPRAVIPVRVNGKAVSFEIISNVQAFFIFYILIFVFGSLIMSFMGLDFKTSLGATATCLGNIGPGIGTVGPVANFAHLPEAGKWFLSFLMLLGRLELFTVLIIFSPAFWKR
ncbi:MAG: TrkH family potassium uptake protein [Ignavibacteriaceae bacterium]|nr:TrkH family potassium uptake protein [Ignavibacteriaceae bacterium]